MFGYSMKCMTGVHFIESNSKYKIFELFFKVINVIIFQRKGYDVI